MGGVRGAQFGEICERHRRRFVSVARRMLRNEEDAKDAVQDAFLSAFQSRHALRREESWTPWMYRIVVNACLMKLRTRRRRRELALEDIGYLGERAFADAFTGGGERFLSAERLVEWREIRSALGACLDVLPERYRTVVRLRDLEGLDTNETARRLRTSPNVIKVRLHRARRALRRLMRDRLAGVGRVSRAHTDESPARGES